MNYQRIYHNLIERAQHRDLPLIFEKHHIIPKCIGGSDDLINIICFTPAEHFLAHQLLTKIYPLSHGLKKAVFMMTVGHNTRRKNKAYSWIKGQLIDNTVYEIEYIDGSIISGSRQQLEEQCNFSSANISRLINKKVKYANGWFFSSHTIKEKEEIKYEYFKQQKNENIYEFENINGVEFTGTIAKFSELYNISKAAIQSLVRNDRGSIREWFMPAFVTEKTYEQIKNTYGIHTLCHKSGKIVTGTRHEIMEQTGLNSNSMSSLLTSRYKFCDGWSNLASRIENLP